MVSCNICPHYCLVLCSGLHCNVLVLWADERSRDSGATWTEKTAGTVYQKEVDLPPSPHTHSHCCLSTDSGKLPSDMLIVRVAGRHPLGITCDFSSHIFGIKD